MGQSVRGDAERAAGRGVDVDLPPAELLDAMIVAMRNADIDAGLRPSQAFGWNPGVLERAPGNFEQQALLRVHDCGFARGNAEEASVKRSDIVE